MPSPKPPQPIHRHTRWAWARALSMAIWCAGMAPAHAQARPPVAATIVSHDDVQAYLTAKGMGMARAAEIDGVPGPFHALAMAHELGLTPDQLARTQQVFDRMEARSSTIGRQIIEQERLLDQQLSDPRVSAVQREAALQRVGQLHRALRQVHQEAHAAQRSILSAQQITQYRELRTQAAAVATRAPALLHASGDTDR